MLAEALLLNEEYEEAMATYRNVLEADQHSQEARKGLEQAEKLYKRSKEIDYYKLLNVTRSASSREIKRAYHKLAVEYHPDKNPDDRDAAEIKFKAVAQAYEVRCSPSCPYEVQGWDSCFPAHWHPSPPHTQPP